MERFTVGGHGFPFSAPMFLAPQHHPQVPQSTAPAPMLNHNYPNRIAPPVGVPTFNFTQAEVDSVLYGYTKTRDKKCNGHALSGLRIGDLSHGEYKTIIISLRMNKGSFNAHFCVIEICACSSIFMCILHVRSYSLYIRFYCFSRSREILIITFARDTLYM